MKTPFDHAIEDIKRRKYHNHRLETHSDIVSRGIVYDLAGQCTHLCEDLTVGKVDWWTNVKAPGNRGRKIDLVIGEPDAEGKYDPRKIRIALENKSVVTAHRNRDNRFDDLKKSLEAVHRERPEAVMIATVLVGLASRVLNVPDQVKKQFINREEEFQTHVLPRLSSGDQSLWRDFEFAISHNTGGDPATTVQKLRLLPTRRASQSSIAGYDYVLFVPAHIDNVIPPSLPRKNPLKIDIEKEYPRMLQRVCEAYRTRFGP